MTGHTYTNIQTYAHTTEPDGCGVGLTTCIRLCGRPTIINHSFAEPDFFGYVLYIFCVDVPRVD
jgi:hypothetical protein